MGRKLPRGNIKDEGDSGWTDLIGFFAESLRRQVSLGEMAEDKEPNQRPKVGTLVKLTQQHSYENCILQESTHAGLGEEKVQGPD